MVIYLCCFNHIATTQPSGHLPALPRWESDFIIFRLTILKLNFYFYFFQEIAQIDSVFHSHHLIPGSGHIKCFKYY